MDNINNNNHLDVITKLDELLISHPSSKKTYDYLRVLVSQAKKNLDMSDDDYRPEKLSRQRILAIAEKQPVSEIDSSFAKDKVNMKAIRQELERFIIKQPDCEEAFKELKYRPIIKQSKPVKGAGNKTLYWLDIEPFDTTDDIDIFEVKSEIEVEPMIQSVNNEECIDDVLNNDLEDEDDINYDWSTIDYERASKSKIKPSLFSRFFFKDGELKMMSFKGIMLMILLVTSLLVDVFIVLFAILVIIYIKELPTLGLFGQLTYLALLPLAYTSYLWLFKPLHHLMTHRVSKAPMFFTSINTDNADVEMYKGTDNYRIARITAFTSTCPICTAPIELAEGKPDEKAPLVGRCREAPHAHVYSFDRVTLKGYFLGHEGYLKS